MTEQEQWRPVPGYDGYAISDRGSVVSTRRPQARELRGGLSGGYRTVALYPAPRVQQTKFVHRLVALAFLGPRPEGAEVRHLDGDKLNNSLRNLAYGSRAENMSDRIAHGTDPQASKTACPQSHPYDETNTYRYGPGKRYRGCRTCRRASRQAYLTRRPFAAANVVQDVAA